MARTPFAARILMDPAFSDGYESNQSGELGGHSLVEACQTRYPVRVRVRLEFWLGLGLVGHLAIVSPVSLRTF